jgi:hypothetical protein
MARLGLGYQRGVHRTAHIARMLPYASRLALVSLVICASCATPQAIKDTSKKQLQLLDSINKATISLQQGLDEFHRDQASTIQDWARIEIATQTIESLSPTGSTTKITPDALFDADKASIQPLVDGVVADIDLQESDLDARISKATNPLVQSNLQLQKQRLQREKDKWIVAAKDYCGNCETTRNQALTLLRDEESTSRVVDLHLEILRAQIQVMSQMASAVDTWLGIDVTLTQDQASQLDQAYKDAIAKLGTKK